MFWVTVKKQFIQGIGMLHRYFIFSRRTKVLSKRLAQILPSQGLVLDVGSGNGLLAKKIMAINPKLNIVGIDVLAREKSFIPVKLFDGARIPYPDKSFDCVMFVDVIHHLAHQRELLQEAARVTQNFIVIKDHYADSLIKRLILRCLDWVGNRAYGVALPFLFLSRREWRDLWRILRLKEMEELHRINLYPFPFNRILDWPWNFIIKLQVT